MRRAGSALGVAAGLIVALGATDAAPREQANPAAAAKPEGASGTSSAFVPGLYRARFRVLSVSPNPYVPSGFKASPDYTYLYIPTSVYRSPPVVANHRFAPDMRFLLNPALGTAIASGYSWNYSNACKGPVSVTQLDPSRARSSGRQASGQERTRSADTSGSFAGLLGDKDGQWRASPSLEDMPLADSLRRTAPGSIVRYSCQDRRS